MIKNKSLEVKGTRRFTTNKKYGGGIDAIEERAEDLTSSIDKNTKRDPHIDFSSASVDSDVLSHSEIDEGASFGTDKNSNFYQMNITTKN